MSIVEVFPAPFRAQESHHLPGADAQRNSSHGPHRAEGLVHAPQVDRKWPAGAVPASRPRSTLRIVPGHLHGTARRPG